MAPQMKKETKKVAVTHHHFAARWRRLIAIGGDRWWRPMAATDGGDWWWPMVATDGGWC